MKWEKVEKYDPPVWSMEIGDFFDPFFLFEKRTTYEEHIENNKRVRVYRTTWIYVHELDLVKREIKAPRPM